MLPSDSTLCLSICGIDNAFEASGLIRLFHPGDPVMDPMPEAWRALALDALSDTRNDGPSASMAGIGCDVVPDSLAIHEIVIRLDVTQINGQFLAVARVFLNGAVAGRSTLSFDLTPAPGKADLLLKSPKLAAGTALYRALEQAFGLVLPWGSLTGVRPVKLASGLLAAGYDDAEARSLLVTRTGMSLDKAELLLSVAHNERPYLQIPADSVSVYVGIPFCATRCLYCSFPAYDIGRMGHLMPAYLDALAQEIRFLGEWIARKGIPVSTVYVGGGTPTALDAPSLARLLTVMREWLPMAQTLEFTVEAGRPDTLDPEKLSLIRDARATRISINPQSMRDDTLRRIGRAHTAADVVHAFEMARAAGFDNINADLIAGLPGETRADFQTTLARMGSLAPDSLTVHTLAVKRASRLHEQESGGMATDRTDDDTVAGMLADAADFAREQGLAPYYLYRQKNILANLENVGYARPGMGCRYNVETMSERQTILAVGSGAITKISHAGRHLERVFNVRELHHYIDRIEEMIGKKRDLLDRHFPDCPTDHQEREG